jgi:hypothetical protein
MSIRSISPLALVAALAALTIPAQAATRTFEVLNQTTGYHELVMKKMPTGTVLIHAGVTAGGRQAIQVPDGTDVYVWIDRTGCSPWSQITSKRGNHTFTILPNCKVEVTNP